MNLSYLLTRTALRYPERPAIISDARSDNYGVLDERVSRLASGLRGLGIEEGARIGIVCDSEPRGLESLFGVLRAGMVLVPMNPRLHPREHAYMLRNCGAAALICGLGYLDDLVAVAEECPDGMHVIGFDAGVRSDGVRDFDSLLSDAEREFPDAEVLPDALAWIFYTSGTTGNPKGAMLTHRNLLTMVQQQLLEISPVQPDDRLAYVAPISHSSGLMAFQHVARGAGHVFAAQPKFDAGRYFDLVERYRITTTFMVPTMIELLLEERSREKRDLSSLHTIVYGGAPMYVDRLREAVDLFGPIFVQIFAQGEAPMACTSLKKHEHVCADDETAGLRLGSAGRESIGVEVRVVDDGDAALPPLQTGQIVVRGDLVMKGYWGNPDASRETLRNGWLHTGDVGHFDESGYLFITDRIKDVIITGGYNVYPREVEEVLYRHPSVLEATVFGVPDPKWGERIVAAVALRADHEVRDSELIEYCRGYVASYKKPSAIHFLPELPKSGYGKILKREVRDLLYPGS